MSKYAGFNSVQLKAPERSTFDLSHEVRLSTRMGKLTPIMISETLPNDTFYGSAEVYIKFAPMIAPIMHRVNMYVHHFFVPNRLLWEDWEKFITGGQLGNEVTSPPVPPRAGVQSILDDVAGYLDKGSLWNYLGGVPIPDSAAATWGNTRTIDLLPFCAFYKVWYDYYRDRNFHPDNTILPMPSGTTTQIEPLRPRYRCWEHDYFTSALPWTQRGAEVLMPMDASANWTYKNQSVFIATGTNLPVAGSVASDNTPTPGGLEVSGAQARLDNINSITVANSNVSINDFRRAMALQSWLERNALAGSRYNESILAHFGRKSSDARLQRAEYLGGAKAICQIGEVMTTSYSEDDSSAVVPPANPSGKGAAYQKGNTISYNCEEHGFIISILSVMPTSGYMQGIPRMFQNRNTFLDYAWPTFAHLGEQEVYKWEIFGDTTNVTADRATAPVFGYQSRYVDWKQLPSRACGDFATNLDMWHLTRKFSTSPVLAELFVTFEDSLQDRIFNVSGVDTLWCYIHNNFKVKRALPYFGTPRIIG